jgi:rod shape-determining protein MreB
MEVRGRDLVSGIPKTAHVSASEIREAMSEPVAQIVEATLRALELTPPELASDIVDQGIMLTGGGALIRGLDRLLMERTGLPVHVDPEPLTCVVRGTAAVLEEFGRFQTALAA